MGDVTAQSAHHFPNSKKRKQSVKKND